VKIAVISDTHIGDRVRDFAPCFLDKLGEFDAVIHCGDITTADALHRLQNTAKSFYGVCGNMDDSIISTELPQSKIFTLANLDIGLMHGWGSPNNLGKRVLERLQNEYPKIDFDIVLFGHSHRPFDKIINGVRVLNPGALSGNAFSRFGSWGILEIADGKIKWTIDEIER